MHGNWCPSASAGSGTAEELCEEASHESQSKVCFVFGLNPVPSNTGQDCVTTALKICSFSDLRCSLLRPNHEVRAGMDLCRPYACFLPASQSDTISDKTLVSRSLSLLDLLHRPWSYLQDPINEHYCMCIQFVCTCTCLLMSKTWEIIILLPLLPRQYHYKYRSMRQEATAICHCKTFG